VLKPRYLLQRAGYSASSPHAGAILMASTYSSNNTNRDMQMAYQNIAFWR